ncbi:MAG: SCO family protein [Myxococcota bacterium]
MDVRWIEPLRWLMVGTPLLAAVAVVGVPWDRAEPEWLPAGGDFTVNTAEGPLALHDWRGSVGLVYFGFGSCADVCPTSLASIGRALESLEPGEVEHVRGLFVSLDPERDSLALLHDLTALVHPALRGGTAPVAELRPITDRYGVAWRKTEVDSALGYVIDHSSTVSVIAPDGQLVEQLRHGTPPDAIAAAIRRHLP